MKNALLGAVAALGLIAPFVACSSEPSAAEATGTDQAEVEMVTSPEAAPECHGWTCARPGRVVSDDQIHDLLGRVEHGKGVPIPPTVAVTSVECAEVHSNCQAPSCTVRTSCGGGGPLRPEDAALLDAWLRARQAPSENNGWATRTIVTNLSCRRGGSGARCSFSSSTPPSSSSGSSGTTH